MANNQITECQLCGEAMKKRVMRPIYTAESSSMPPRILCYLCQRCYWDFLEDLEIFEKYVSRHTKGENK